MVGPAVNVHRGSDAPAARAKAAQASSDVAASSAGNREDQESAGAKWYARPWCWFGSR